MRVSLGARGPSDDRPQGRVGCFVGPSGSAGALVHVQCVTDFVAQNQEVAAFVDDLAQALAEDPDALGRPEVERRRMELAGYLGENIVIVRAERLAVDD